MRHLFFSPHLDDAVFSAGDLIAHLTKQNHSVTVITLFSKFVTKKSLSLTAKKFINDCGYKSLIQFQSQRIKEDKKALKLLKANFKHLNFTDALFRHQINLKQLFSSPIFIKDYCLILKLYLQIKKIIQPNDILYAPLAIGRHLDHRLINLLIKRFNQKTYFWVDQPYINQRLGKKQLNQLKPKMCLKLKPKKTKRKILAAKEYSSQINLIFPQVIKFTPEAFYTYL